jgi:pilus assembly protein CpaF
VLTTIADLNAYYRDFAPLDELLADDRVSEIMVNGIDQVYKEVNGKLVDSGIKFADKDALVRVIQKLGENAGRRIDSAQPMMDARMQDGSRVNAVLAPVSVDGPSLTIRKFARSPLTAEDLLKVGTYSEAAMGFLQAAVASRLNIVVTGGTSSGKTTLLNILSGFIPDDERIVTIEDTAELQLRQRHVVKLEARIIPQPGEAKVEIRDLVINALRMRPDRIVVGECRGGETMDMLQAMNTGHDGGLTTLHANSPRDTLTRLETMALMSGMEMPLLSVRRQIASAIHLIVQMARLRDGSRRVVKIEEVIGMEGEVVTMQEVFGFVATGTDAQGRTAGELQPLGIRPKMLVRMTEAGIEYPASVAAIWPSQAVWTERRKGKK